MFTSITNMRPDLLAQAAATNTNFQTLDLILFLVAVIGVIWLGIWKSKDEAHEGEKSASDYFLAGRGLTWWLVGFSLIAANISTEQFVGMSGQAANWLGMAIASYEWLAAITLVVVAFVFLPKLLRCGIYTIPEFLEYRYGPVTRTIMAIITMIILVGVPTASVIYSGAKVISVFFAGYSLFGVDFGNLTVGCIIIALSAAIYVYVGGLKACAWTDLIWGVALIAGGGVVMYLAFHKLGGMDPSALIDTKVATSQATVESLSNANAWDRFLQLNSGAVSEGPNMSGGKLNMIRPISDPEIPWTALIIGLWIPNFFYWGLNQYIMQRTLGSKSLAEGQKGIVFAAFLKLIIPFVIVIPGILAFNLFSSQLRDEATKKNDKPLSEIAQNSAKVYHISENFALVRPEQAQQVLLHNAAKVGFDKIKSAEGKLDAAALQASTVQYVQQQITAGKLKGDIATISEKNLSQDFQLLFEANQQDKEHKQGILAASKHVATINDNLLLKAKEMNIEQGSKIVGYDYDAAFPTLLKELLQSGISWFVLAAIFGAVVSSLASMLNSASTIFTMDLYHKIRPTAQAVELVKVGKIGVLVCMLISLSIAPFLDRFGAIFTFIQQFQGFISPGVLGIFLFAFLSPRTPRYFGVIGILMNAVLYGILLMFFPEIAFLNCMAICLGAVLLTGILITMIKPLPEPIVIRENAQVPLETNNTVKMYGVVVILLTLALYIYFW